MQRGLEIALIIAIIIMAGVVGFLFFRQIPKQIAKNTEPVYTVATYESVATPSPALQISSQTVSIKNTSDLNASSGDLDGVDFTQFDKELNEVDF